MPGQARQATLADIPAMHRIRLSDGNIWALFVHPEQEARGHGRTLHDTMLAWLRSRGLSRLWLTTGPGTRAERFYRKAGWQDCGLTAKGETLFELHDVLKNMTKDA